jgi:hypothetical protein
MLELAMQYPAFSVDWLATATDEDLATILDINAAEVAAIEKAGR